MNEIEGESRELATIPQVSGVRALAQMSDAEFDHTLAAIRKGQERILKMQQRLLVEKVDYGNVPGVDKPSLAKPGAEKLCLAYGLVARIETTFTPGDGITTPPITYEAICWLHVGSFEGPIVGMGHGTCSSWETKYRYRDSSYVCPKCGMSLRHSKQSGWYCWAAKGGCGWETKKDDDPAVKSQTVGRIDNPDPHELANTIMKMAEKRAHVDATLRATGASGIFTQDMEENAPSESEPKPEPAARPARVEPANTPREPSPEELAALRGEPIDRHVVTNEDLAAEADLGSDEPKVAMTISELKRRASGAVIGLSQLSEKSKEMFERPINLLTNDERYQLAVELGLA
jgi:hypothetical protein